MFADLMNSPAKYDTELKSLLDYLFSIRRLPREEYNQRVSAYLDRRLTEGIAPLELSRQLRNIFYTHSLTDAGINSNLGFFPELSQRLKYRLLPPVNEDNYFSHVVPELFVKKENYQVLEKISDANWGRLSGIAELDALTPGVLRAQLENAIIILTHRFATIGIDPYIVKKVPHSDDADSPFFRLNVLVNDYLKVPASGNMELLLSTLDTCEAVFGYLKENRAVLGISLHLTFLIRRAEQHAARIRLLLRLHAATNTEERNQLAKELVLILVRAELYSASIRYFISENTSLLANRIANQTSAKGGDYIGFSKKENQRLLLSAMGGGGVVVFLVYIKHFIHKLHLPLLPEGILFGLNYGIGFVFMHYLHLTLATKQPAMTASYIAESIEQKGLSRGARRELSVILAQIMRSQFISLIGNLVVVLPLCFLSAWLFVKLSWYHVFNEAEAYAHLKSNHPLLSGSLLYAVITGIFLTLAGLITGYYDNKIVFSGITKRVMNHPVLRRVLPYSMLERAGGLISRHAGAVIGNLCLGMFLGLAGNFGKFIGIPFDIRHITISAGNFGIAIAQGYGFSQLFVLLVLSGVLAIGIINIISSFTFSFLIACRSRYLSSRQTWLVLGSMILYIFRNPGILIFRKEDSRNSPKVP